MDQPLCRKNVRFAQIVPDKAIEAVCWPGSSACGAEFALGRGLDTHPREVPDHGFRDPVDAQATAVSRGARRLLCLDEHSRLYSTIILDCGEGGALGGGRDLRHVRCAALALVRGLLGAGPVSGDLRGLASRLSIAA
jgi:hypothetical protein